MCISNNDFKKLIQLVKDCLTWSKKYWDRSHQYGEEEYTQQDINEAFNNWNWAEKDLKDFILKIEEANKTNDTMDSEKKFTRITHESSYGVKTVLNFDSEDLGPEDYIQAIVTIMVSATFVPVTIYRTMYEYSRDALKALGDEEV